jgi:hypothetical protein
MSEQDAARFILRYLVRQWYCTDVPSACDLLDDTCDAAVNSGIVTTDEIQKWRKKYDEDVEKGLI